MHSQKLIMNNVCNWRQQWGERSGGFKFGSSLFYRDYCRKLKPRCRFHTPETLFVYLLAGERRELSAPARRPRCRDLPGCFATSWQTSETFQSAIEGGNRHRERRRKRRRDAWVCLCTFSQLGPVGKMKCYHIRTRGCNTSCGTQLTLFALHQPA